jgi:hypothetical protein
MQLSERSTTKQTDEPLIGKCTKCGGPKPVNQVYLTPENDLVNVLLLLEYLS